MVFDLPAFYLRRKRGKARSVSRVGLLIGYNDSGETVLQVRRFVAIELSRFALEGR
jgi:hypothetical protein